MYCQSLGKVGLKVVVRVRNQRRGWDLNPRGGRPPSEFRGRQNFPRILSGQGFSFNGNH